MSKKLSVLLVGLCMFTLTGCVNQHQQLEGGQQEAGSSQSVKKEHKIVATSVALLEILDALEVEGVVGIPTTASTLPERYQGITEVGAPMSPEAEIVSSLNPTIVISPKSLKAELSARYETIGVESYFVDLSSVDGMYTSIQKLGQMFDKEEKASELIQEYETWLEEIKTIMNQTEQKNVLVLMGLPGSYTVATENSYVGSLVKMAGGKNVYEGYTEEEFLNINTEDMLEKNPDIILRTAHALPEQVMSMFKEEFETNDIWKHFDAVKNKKVYDLDHTHFGMSANFSYKEAVEEVVEYLK